MELKLAKTFLSRKPSSWNFMVAVIGLGVMALFFGAEKQHFSANGYLVFEKREYWRLFTTTLLHADLNHLAHNAFFFSGLAALLHTYFGFWIFPVLSVIVGAMINLVALWYYDPQVHLVGVSGVIYFMASFWLTLYILIERRQKILVRFVHAIAVTLIFLFPQVFEQNVSYLAHGLGFVFGIPLGLFYYATFRKEIRSRDEYIEVKKTEHDGVIPLDESSYHLVQPEESEPSQHASDSSQYPKH